MEPPKKAGRGLKVLFFCLGGFSLLVLIAVIGFLIFGKKMAIKEGSILEVNLEANYPEVTAEGPFSFGKKEMTLSDLAGTIDRAASDDRVKGMIARIGMNAVGMAEAQEIRDAVKRFRAKKKFAVAYSETFGEFQPGNSAYFVATAFDEIYLQPSGDVCLNGFVFEAPFLKGTFEKIGVKPEFDHRKEYKNAMNSYTEKAMTPAHREAMDAILQSRYRQFVAAIAEARKMSEDEVRKIIDNGPYLGPEASKAKLVDGLAYWDEVSLKVRNRGGKGAKLIRASVYFDREGTPNQDGDHTIALIHGIGGVSRGKSKISPLTGGATMGSDTVAHAFRKAAEDKSVKAIVFRVSSPGGSYVASDAIWREVVNAKKAGKPVIVTMGEVAGSGGYFVAMAADKIVAQPATITGSIGVLGGKMVTKEMWEKLGLTFDQVEAGANANMWNASRSFTPAEWARFQAWLDRVYDDFTKKVAEGRKLPLEKVQEIAKGRIWTGEDAKKIGLVDELGGEDVAFKLALKAAGLKETDSFKVEVFPKKKTPFEAIMATLQGQEEETAVGITTSQEEFIRAIRPHLKKLEVAGILGEQPGVLSVPPMEFR
jgi:protease-4